MRKVLFIFGDLNDGDIDWLATVGTRREYAAGMELIREGRPIAEVLILLEGRLEVLVGGTQARRIASLHQGEIVGELSFLDSRPPNATVVAAVDSVTLAVPRAQLSTRLARDTAFAARFYRALGVFLAERLRSTVVHLGFGKGVSLEEDEVSMDEIDPQVLDTLALAARRFEILLARCGPAK